MTSSPPPQDIYPSDDFKSDYMTSLPQIFAITVASVFCLVALIFLVYDCFVQRRNKELVKDAVRSDKLVTSLFPEEIKDQVLAQHDDTVGISSQRKKGLRKLVPISVTSKTSNLSLRKVSETEGGGTQAVRQLAKIYPETTIFFGDLAGFTKWSSTRQPEQVFDLLEALCK